MNARQDAQGENAEARPDLSALFAPRNVVLIGASDRNWSVRVDANLSRLGFAGEVYLVNPNRSELWGRRCYSSLADLPEAPDHLALFVPAEQTIAAIEAAGQLGGRSASLFAAGFGEGGEPEGRLRAERLRVAVAQAGIAAVGPNCMGLAVGRSRFATIPDEHLEIAAHGQVAIITQSGMLIQTLSRGIEGGGASISCLISCGNQTGLTFADYIAHLADDPELSVLACYVEGIVDGPAFIAAARKAREHGKTVVVTKIGGSEKARRAALAHTGSLAGSLEAFDVFAREAGIVRAETIEDLVETTILLARAPRPRGKNIALLTNSGALRSLAVESGDRMDVSYSAFSEETQARIRASVPDLEPVNPLDTKRTLPTAQYMEVVAAAHDDPGVDMVLLAEELPRAPGIDRKVANFRALDRFIREKARKPVVCFAPVTLAHNDYMECLKNELPSIPWLRDLTKTLRVASRLGPEAVAPLPPSYPSAAFARLRELLGARLGDGASPVALSEAESKEIFAAFGIGAPREIMVPALDARAAEQAAASIGYPVVLKVVSSRVTHKSDAGLVLLGMRDAGELARGVALLEDRCSGAGFEPEGLLVAQQVSGGVEAIVGLHRDPEMGPVVMAGLGGVWLELFRDVAFGPPGLDESRAREMIARTRMAKLLDGYRGAPRCDAAAFADAILRMGALAIELGDLVESAEINPLIVQPEGVFALDALIILRSRQNQGR